MDRRQIATKLLLDSLNQELDLSDFNSRLILQKTIYLVQAAGVKLGYHYSWYLRGPYSRGLTSDLFEMKDEIREFDESSNWHLDKGSIDVIAKVKDLFVPPGDDSSHSARYFELLASVLFLVKTKQVSDDPSHLKIKLESLNKSFGENEISDALESLNQYSLL